MKMVNDKTKTGLVFHYIRQNGAQTINEVEKALGIDAYAIMHSMKDRGLLLFSSTGTTSRTGIFEILPKTVHTQENIKTPLSAFNKKVGGYNDKVLRITLPQNKKTETALQVLKYAVGNPKRNSLQFVKDKTHLDISVNDDRIEVIANIINGMRKDGYKIDATVLEKKVVKTLEPRFSI